jgi:hypothetical protein
LVPLILSIKNALEDAQASPKLINAMENTDGGGARGGIQRSPWQDVADHSGNINLKMLNMPKLGAIRRAKL